MTRAMTMTTIRTTKSMTMTRSATTSAPTRRNAKLNGAVWKSGLLALCLATVAAGTAVIGRLDGGQQPIEQVGSQVVVVQQLPSGELLVRRDVPADSLATLTRISVPAMPQRPVFRQPLTRTRGS